MKVDHQSLNRLWPGDASSEIGNVISFPRRRTWWPRSTHSSRRAGSRFRLPIQFRSVGIYMVNRSCMYMCVCMYIYIYIYIMRKAHCGDPMFGICYVEKGVLACTRRSISKVVLFNCGETPLLNTIVSPRPYTCCQVYALFRYGETTLSACTC